MTAELETAQTCIQEFDAALEARAQSEEEVRSAFIVYLEFKRAVSHKAYIYFETSFEKF